LTVLVPIHFHCRKKSIFCKTTSFVLEQRKSRGFGTTWKCCFNV